jgi:PST family polysaccharide transporter
MLTDASASIGRRAMGSALWALAALGAYRALAFATTVVLARLLDPADFGIVSFAMVLIGAMTLLQDLGVPASIIFSHRPPRELAGTALSMNLAAALVLFAITAIGAPWLSDFTRQPAVGPVAATLALGLVIASMGSFQGALLEKEMAFRRKFLPDVVPLLTSGLTSILLALRGLGAWSLVIGYLVRMSSATILLWCLSPVRPRPEFRWSAAVELFRYGRHASLNSIVGFAQSNVDYLLVGWLLGSADLGLYTLAFTIGTLPITVSSEVVARVSFPALSTLRADTRGMVDLFLRVFSVVSWLALLASSLLFVGAPAFAPVVLGHKWDGIVPPLQILATFAFVGSIGYTLPAAFKAIGRPDILWKLSLLRLILLPPLMLALLPLGVSGVALAQVIVQTATLPLAIAWLTHTLGFPIGRVARAVTPPLVATVVTAGLIALAYALPQSLDARANPAVALGLMAVMCAAYLLLLRAFHPQLVAVGQASVVSLLRSQRATA